MNVPRWAPPAPLLRQSAQLAAAGVVIVAVVWWLVDSDTAHTVYFGMVFMAAGVISLRLSEQIVLGLTVGAAAAVGSLVTGNTVLLIVVTVVACLVQWPFNRRSAAVAALLPYVAVLYATAPGPPLRIAFATWLGAAAMMGLMAVARIRTPAQPVATAQAVRHALALAVGCVAVILVATTVGLPKGTWAVLTLCLVFMPITAQTGTRVRQRVVGTAAGAIAAAAIVLVAPPALCLVAAGVCAVLNVAYTFHGKYGLSIAFLTPTVLLPYASGQPIAILSVSAQRLAMTLLGGVLALALTALTVRLTPTHQPDEIDPTPS